MTRPEETLTAPRAEDPMPGVIPFFAGGNFISPAYYISTIVKGVIGFDIFGWASEKVQGDWEAVRKAAEAAGNLSRFNSAFADSVQAGWRNTVEQSWHGEAAGSAGAYFNQLAATLDFQVRPLEEIERQLTNISTGMRELARLVGDILQDIADWGLLLGASMAAQAVLAATLVGGPAAAAQAAISATYVVMIIQRVDAAITLVTRTYKTIYGGIGALNVLSSQTMPDKLPPLPNSAYNHPGA
ncbi:WXG100 family type VII secretion target [Nocardia transvalensis]|uniref:WXG100 family type VII secretion target n=1 Tax=Nocardia transvalensis TaxID=37333 RepID=UPI0018956342|nr:WXG100 family type VII secretion target [Nocardia transvalensis]MBF6333884.1 hypothetical protein [Nocardia transvalensis]